MAKILVLWLLSLHSLFSALVYAQVDHNAHAGHAMADEHDAHEMQFDRTGMVMNANSTVLPRGCDAISADVAFNVKAGTQYAVKEAGRIFGFSQYDFHVEPCSRVSVTFVNEDQVRHQWMLHGLPRYLYPQGMFHLEASGGETVQGSFIVPKDDATYLVHCDVAQHMEKGMKAQFVVGAGEGDLWSIPTVSADFKIESGTNFVVSWLLFLSTFAALMLVLLYLKKGLPTR